MSQVPSFDVSIPVLTEVLRDPAHLGGGQRPYEANAAAVEDRATGSFSGHERELLERRVSQRILHQLQARVDFVLEQRIKDSKEEVLSHALRDLTKEIRSGLHDTLSKIVTRAVAQELTHLQAQKK
jgi:hypothetical protein